MSTYLQFLIFCYQLLSVCWYRGKVIPLHSALHLAWPASRVVSSGRPFPKEIFQHCGRSLCEHNGVPCSLPSPPDGMSTRPLCTRSSPSENLCSDLANSSQLPLCPPLLHCHHCIFSLCILSYLMCFPLLLPNPTK